MRAQEDIAFCWVCFIPLFHFAVKIEIQAEILSAGNWADIYVGRELLGRNLCGQGFGGDIVWENGWQEFRHVPCEKQNRQNTAGSGGNATIELGLVCSH